MQYIIIVLYINRSKGEDVLLLLCIVFFSMREILELLNHASPTIYLYNSPEEKLVHLRGEVLYIKCITDI